MLSFLKKSRNAFVDVKNIINETKETKEDVQKARIQEAISKLKDISAQESEFYKQIKKKKGIYRSILENEIKIILALTESIIKELRKGKIESVLPALDYLLQREKKEDDLVQRRLRIRREDEERSLLVKPILEKYIQSGMIVVELFHGERSDILRALSMLVGKRGHITGIDEFNPYLPMYENMQDIASLPNVTLIKAHFPPLPTSKVDAIVVREFHYIFDSGRQEVCFAELDKKIKRKGFPIILLNKAEYGRELVGGNKSYFNAIARFPHKYQQVAFNQLELVFQKM